MHIKEIKKVHVQSSFFFFKRIMTAIGWRPTSEAIGKRERCICDSFVGSAIATGLDEEPSAPGSHD